MNTSPTAARCLSPREIVLPVRIDQRIGRRQRLVGLMMVDDHHVEAELLRLGERRDAGGAAIDRDQQPRALLGERAHGFGVRPVALEQAIRNVDQRIAAGVAQEPRQHRRRGGAVDVVVAEDRYLSCRSIASAMRVAAFGMSVSASGSASAAAPSDRGIPRRVGFDIASGQHARQQFGYPRGAARSRAPARRPLVEAVAPDAAAHRSAHVEKEPAQSVRQCRRTSVRPANDGFQRLQVHQPFARDNRGGILRLVICRLRIGDVLLQHVDQQLGRTRANLADRTRRVAAALQLFFVLEGRRVRNDRRGLFRLVAPGIRTGGCRAP